MRFTYNRNGLKDYDDLSALSYSKFGYNSAVGTVLEPIWAESAVAYVYPTTGQALTLSAANAADTAAGTGMRSISITWLDDTFNEQTTTLGLNGQTGVALGTGLRINRMFGLSYGTGLANAGIIYVGYGAIVAGKPATVLASIVAGENQTLQMVYTVPAGYTLVMTSAAFYPDNKGEGRLYQRPVGLGFRITRTFPTNGSPVIQDYHDAPLVFGEKTDLELRGKSAVATIAAGAEFHGKLYKNP